MTVLLNPSFNHLRKSIESIPERFENEGKIIYRGRNLIKVMSIEGVDINVKRYAIPMLFNRIIYSFFRSPKGRRAFDYPKLLLEKGFQTPMPIAYIEKRRYGLIQHSYFISLQCPYKRNFYEFGDADITECTEVVKAFAHYTACLHEAGILHRDYSPGNILFDKVEGKYQFSLVDINRMSFGKVSIKNGCANFARLWGQIPFFKYIAKEYAIARGADEVLCSKWILAYRKKFWKRFARRHVVKYNLKIE
ncbi:lipopolysaccharide kinase InaA family protein [uncultured Bacteroides sp.]|uniref:lipopolysaccharide kinase InaA family protein n=1 Tax=uncultured Bacteroides sp. TaxID=162156 RepID=UPI002AAB1CFA|nr:lipopolysaccharide kinase InaA family protein [uncultured Bacteroides sp.]